MQYRAAEGRDRRKMVGDATRIREEQIEMSVPFALSLTAGILIIFSSTIFTILLWILTMFGNGGFIGEMMNGDSMNGDSMMGDIDGGFNNFMPFVTGILSVGIVSGALVLVGSLMMYYKRSKQVKSWGIVVVIFSIVALIVGGGGFLIGTILGIIGGALAIGRAR
jgi:Family of unknown function (DUF6114)